MKDSIEIEERFHNIGSLAAKCSNNDVKLYNQGYCDALQWVLGLI